MKFVDRVDELNILEKEYARNGSSFVVIYGRRRLGKTTLISKFCEDKKNISFLATEESEQENLNSFKEEICNVIDNNLLRESNITSWEPLFNFIADNTDEKLIVVLDEFQFLGKANEAFPSILMKIWDKKLKNTNIMLILCGSLIRMMNSQVLSYNSPLYGRRTAQIRMKQIDFKYYSEFFDTISYDEQILRYAITGGVPKYIELFEGKGTIRELIRDNIMNTGSFLYEEPEFLLRNEINEVGRYYTILKIIANGKHKLSEICAASEISQAGIGAYIKNLTELDIITREVPVTEANPEKSRMGQYLIKDNFLHFWFRFVYPYRSMIERGQTNWVLDKIEIPFIDNYVSYVYEDICREKVFDELSGSLNITRIGRWWDNKTAEIDIVGLSDDSNKIIFGECKYSKKKKGMGILNELIEKAKNVKWKNDNREEYYVICSKSGFDDKLTEYAKEHDNIYLFEG